ncbi:type II secretion system minor pseudopilin GspI (plasmid) [Marinovum sp. KMM 9989]
MSARQLGPRRGDRGFTLVEVLCAVAVLSIALVASFKLINQQTRASAGLTDRVLAHWVALNVLEERRLGITGTAFKDSRDMGGIAWQIDITDTAGPADLTRVAITVASEGHAGARLIGYLPPAGDDP